MLAIAGGVMLGILGARLLMRAPGLLFVFGPPVLAAFFLTRGYETLGAVLFLAVALFWSSFAITYVHEMWGAARDPAK